MRCRTSCAIVTVLVLTSEFDPTADLVIAELEQRDIVVFRCDTADFPTQLTLTARLDNGWRGALENEYRKVALSDIKAVYYRRPSGFRLPPGMNPAEQKFAEAEARLGFGGVLCALNCRWLNHPFRIAEADVKPYQLALAERNGLFTPRTLVTNNAEEQQLFATLVRNLIYKPLSLGPASDQGRPVALYTAAVDPSDYGSPAIRTTAHLFQEYISKSYEVRVTVVAEQHFAVRIDIEGCDTARLDWRIDYRSHRYQVVDPPLSVRSQVGSLLAQLGLSFAALDFIVTPDGRWIFLEINPNGQWAWLEQAAGLNITSAIAGFLRGDEHGR